MTKLERIEREIAALPAEELDRFRAWFAEFDAANWDAQIEADAKAGKLDRLAERALAAHRQGRTKELSRHFAPPEFWDAYERLPEIGAAACGQELRRC